MFKWKKWRRRAAAVWGWIVAGSLQRGTSSQAAARVCRWETRRFSFHFSIFLPRFYPSLGRGVEAEEVQDRPGQEAERHCGRHAGHPRRGASQSEWAESGISGQPNSVCHPISSRDSTSLSSFHKKWLSDKGLSIPVPVSICIGEIWMLQCWEKVANEMNNCCGLH